MTFLYFQNLLQGYIFICRPELSVDADAGQIIVFRAVVSAAGRIWSHGGSGVFNQKYHFQDITSDTCFEDPAPIWQVQIIATVAVDLVHKIRCRI